MKEKYLNETHNTNYKGKNWYFDYKFLKTHIKKSSTCKIWKIDWKKPHQSKNWSIFRTINNSYAAIDRCIVIGKIDNWRKMVKGYKQEIHRREI